MISDLIQRIPTVPMTLETAQLLVAASWIVVFGMAVYVASILRQRDQARAEATAAHAQMIKERQLRHEYTEEYLSLWTGDGQAMGPRVSELVEQAA